MKIAIVGSGNVGGTLATKWAKAGHIIHIGDRDPENFNEEKLLRNDNITVHDVSSAVDHSEVILLATPAMAAIEVAKSLGSTKGKVIIDAMNIVGGRGPEGYNTTAMAILDHTETEDLVKCFNTTGFNIMQDPVIKGQALDMFVAGDSKRGKKIATQLALDVGFAKCYDIGGNDKFQMMEEFARFWINLALFQGLGRDIGFKLLSRK